MQYILAACCITRHVRVPKRSCCVCAGAGLVCCHCITRPACWHPCQLHCLYTWDTGPPERQVCSNCPSQADKANIAWSEPLSFYIESAQFSTSLHSTCRAAPAHIACCLRTALHHWYSHAFGAPEFKSSCTRALLSATCLPPNSC